VATMSSAASRRTTNRCSSPIATACSARWTTPRTCSRDPAPRLAWVPSVRGSKLGSHLVVPDRDQRLPRCHRPSPEENAADRSWPAERADADLGAPLIESVWLEPFPDGTLALPHGYVAPEARYQQQEAVELAFTAALQHLSAKQRAVLLLREVLGFSAREVAESLETTMASVNSTLRRARKTIEQRLPERSQQETLRSLGDEKIGELVEAYVDAWRRADVDRLRALLTEDAVFSMPPWPAWWRGREAIASLAKVAVEVCPDSRTIRARANGQAAIACYQRVAETGRFTAAALDVISFGGARIGEITVFATPQVFPRLGLSEELD
jgi:RNA polymerase sigma-70 factor, ECF subfamily